MPAVASVGTFSQLGIAASWPTSPKGFEFLSESVRKNSAIIDTQGIRATRSHIVERTRTGPYTVSGSIRMMPGGVELDNILPYIMGAGSNPTYTLAETIPAFDLCVDRVAKVFTYTGCKVTKATFSASEGQPMELNIDVEGLTETVGNAASYPSVTLSTMAPYVMMDCALTALSSSRQIKEWELTIENVPDADRFLNTSSRTEIPIIDRMVTFRFVVPFNSDNTDLYNQALAGAAATLVLTNGALSLTFTMAALQIPATGPTVNSKGEIVLELAGQVRKSSSTLELVIANDSTP